VSRSTSEQRYTDILSAIQRCLRYRPHLTADDIGGMAYDAVLRNPAVIGEAVRALPEPDRAAIPDVPWAAIAGLRNVVVHEYFRVDPILDIVDNQLAQLAPLQHFQARGRRRNDRRLRR